MRATDYLGYTWRNFTRARLRLLLTVAAVVIGATLVVVMTSVGGGIQRNVLEDIRGSGGLNEIFVSTLLRPQPAAGTTGRGGILNESTVETIASLPGVTAVVPQLAVFGTVQFAYDGLTGQPL